MAKTNSVSGLAQIFHTRWELRGFHTIFDYVIDSKTLINQAGKALSGWTSQNFNNEISGGLPPSVEIHSKQSGASERLCPGFIQ